MLEGDVSNRQGIEESREILGRLRLDNLPFSCSPKIPRGTYSRIGAQVVEVSMVGEEVLWMDKPVGSISKRHPLTRAGHSQLPVSSQH